MKLKYVINTINSYKQASVILTESLIKDGIDAKDIIYVLAGEQKFDISYNLLGQLIIKVPANLYEFTSILGLSFLFTDDKKYMDFNYLLLHDTCKALKGFKNKILDINNLLENWDICWLHSSGKHNIGIFTAKSILSAYKYSISNLLKKETFDKKYAIRMEWDQVPESLHLLPLKHWFAPNLTLLPNYIKSTMYSASLPRDVAYMTSANLVKYYFFLGPIHPRMPKHPNSLSR